MSTNHQRGDLKDSLIQESEKQSPLERLMSFSSRVSNSIKNKKATIGMAAGLTLANIAFPFFADKALAEWKTIYNKEHTVNIYLKNYNPATQGHIQDKRDMLLNVRQDDSKDKLEITIKKQNTHENIPYLSAEPWINESWSYPYFVHKKDIDLNVEAKGYIIKSNSKKGKWTELIDANKNKKLQTTLESEKKILNELIDLSGLNPDLDDATKEKLNNWWNDFVEYQRKKGKQQIKDKAGKPNWRLTRVEPFGSKRWSGRDNFSIIKYNVDFDFKDKKEQDVYLILGTKLEKNLEPKLYGNLEKQVIGPIIFNKKTHEKEPLQIAKPGFSFAKFINLWNLEKEEDFDLLRKGSYIKFIGPSKQNKSPPLLVHPLDIWFSQDGKEKITSSMETYDIVKRNPFFKNKVSLEIKNSQGSKEDKGRIELKFPGIKSWGELKLNKLIMPLMEINECCTENSELFCMNTELGKGKGSIEGRLFGEISFDDFYQGLQNAKKWGELGVYTIKKGENKIYPAKLSEWKSKKEGVYSIRFLSNQKYSNIENAGFGIFPVLNGKIQGDPFYYTNHMEKAYFRDKDYQNIRIEKLRAPPAYLMSGTPEMIKNFLQGDTKFVTEKIE